MRKPISTRLKIGLLCVSALPSLSSAAWVHFDPANPAKVPQRFSQTGFYTNMTTKVVTSEAAPFEVNTPLWSDAAAKKRWVLLKPGSKKIQFNPEEDYFDYPDSTVFVKLFLHDTIPGDTTSRIYWETRLLIKKTVPDTISEDPLEVGTKDHWYSFSYKWKRDGSEAFLVPASGLDTTLTLTVNGQKRLRKWSFPSVSACNNCHRQYSNHTQGRTVLGFFTPQLNRPTAANPSLNQIRDLFNRGILGWSKPAAPTETEINAMAKWARLDNNQASLDLRARSYIAANCSGCHGYRGKETGAIGHVDINYDYFKLTGGTLTPAMELRDHGTAFWDLEPIVNERGETLQPKLVVPGYPEISILLHRMKVRNEAMPNGTPEDTAFFGTMAQMPPVGVFEQDTAAIRLVTEWIKSIPASIGKTFGRQLANGPVVHGKMLMLPAGAQGKVVLTGIDGRRHDLVRISGRSYQLPGNLPAGIYLLKVGSGSFKLAL